MNVILAALFGIIFFIALIWLLVLVARQCSLPIPEGGQPFDWFTRLGKGLSDWMSELDEEKRAFLYIVVLFLVSRMLLFLLTSMGYDIFNGTKVSFFGGSAVWNKWDAPHYMDLARDGYVNTGDPANFIVFFPLYPLLVRIFYYIFSDFFIAGCFVSYACLLLSGFYLYRLIRIDFDEAKARFAVALLFFYPFSFFFSAPYTEGIFLLTSLLFFYYLRKENYLVAGIAAMLCTLSRMFGLLLLVPYGLQLLLHLKERGLKKVLVQAAPALFAFLGIFIYLYINKVVYGDWFTFMKVQQEHWHNTFTFFVANLVQQLNNVRDGGLEMVILTYLPNVLSAVLALWAVLYTMKKIPLIYSAYSLAYIFMAFAPSWLLSGSRYIMGMVPLYFALTLLCDRGWKKTLIMVSFGMLSAVYAITFTLGKYVF